MVEESRIRRVLISLEIPALEPWNRFSAVACVVCSFAEVLESGGFEVYINQYRFTTVKKKLDSAYGMAARSQPRRPWYRWIPKRIREAGKDLLLLRRLRGLFAAVKAIPRPDCIISWISYGSQNGRKLAEYWSVPLIGIYDNPLCEEYRFLFGFEPFIKPVVERHERRMVLACDRLIVYSEAVAAHLQKKFDSSLKTSVNQFLDRYKINYMMPREPGGLVRILYIGSFFPWHRVDQLVDAFAQIASKHSGVRLCLVGEGPEMPAVRRRVVETGIDDLVEFKGRQDRDELEHILAESHIGVIPSALWFHAPVKLFQYAAAGLCVVAKNTPTIHELAQGHQGAIVLFDTPEDLLNQLELLLKWRERIAKHAETARRFVAESYSDRAYLDFFRHLFDAITLPDNAAKKLRDTCAGRTGPQAGQPEE